MHAVDEAVAVENLGLTGDRHALADSSRQILLIEEETLNELGLQPADVKENITTRGIGLMQLVSGDRLHVGNHVVLEVTKACSPCSRMEEVRVGLQREITGRRGMLTRVLRGGTIAKGDRIQLEKHTPT
jgi:MOSC domain-containing protein YiiM